MELFAKVAHEQAAGVIVVTHDYRALDVFDTVYEMEDGWTLAASQVCHSQLTSILGTDALPICRFSGHPMLQLQALQTVDKETIAPSPTF